MKYYNILWTRRVNKKIRTSTMSTAKIGLIAYIEDVDEDKIEKDIEIKKALEVNIAETMDIKEGHDKRSIIFAAK